MTLPGETLTTGASPTCLDCGETVTLDVHSTPAGYYVGTWCNCGPYSRESVYYASREQAEADLRSGEWVPRR